MGSNLGIALLLGLVGAFAIYDYAIGTNYIFRPLVTGVLVGIVMGDVRQGTIIGASLELMFMGAVSVGAYIPPDIVTGGISGNLRLLSAWERIQELPWPWRFLFP